jgi:DNA-binding NarL/FixJ family response regulator
MVAVGLMDGCPLVREGLKGLLRSVKELVVIWDLCEPSQLGQCLSKSPVQVLVFDPVSHRERDPVRLIAELHQEFHKTSLLVYTYLAADDFAISALRAGASGVLNKDCSVAEIVCALRTIASGQTYLSTAQAQEISMRYLSSAEAKPQAWDLSPREQEVCEGIACGKRLKQIAAELSLSPKTVHTYKTRIMERFRLKSTADLIRFAQRRGDTRLETDV